MLPGILDDLQALNPRIRRGSGFFLNRHGKLAT